ncbi:MAG: hypothetical protein AB1647_03895 [Pseudomonadota bacterium]
MFLEKFSRFFRRYDLTFAPRHKAGAHLPIGEDPNLPNITEALKQRWRDNKALEVQPNGDIVELMDVEFEPKSEVLTLLFHRASPNAADPAYRKKARRDAGGRVIIRTAKKADDEEQSVSAHLVISTNPIRQGVYRSALEEIPGISMSVIRRIISLALQDYQYEFKKGTQIKETYTTFKPEGVQSETLTNALKKGELNFIKLVRPAKPDFVDANGLFEPVNEVMKLRVKGKITSQNWRKELKNLIPLAKEAGWTEFNLDLELDDERHRTIKIDREQEAKEILFVRSEQVDFKRELPICSAAVNPDVVKKALQIIAA